MSLNHFLPPFALLSIRYWLSDSIWIKRSKFAKDPQTLVWVTGCFAEFILHVVGYKLKSSKSKMTYCALEIKWINGC